MQKFTIPGLQFDAGQLQAIVLAATGLTETISTNGNDVYVSPDMTPAQIAACAAAIQAAPAPDPNTSRLNMLAAAKALAVTVNGTAVTALTATQVRNLVILLAANQNWVTWNGSAWVVNVQ